MKKSVVLLFTLISIALQNCSQEGIRPESSNQTIPIKVAVKLKVGEFLYENIETTITVKGFDASNIEKWSANVSYAGPSENVIPLSNGFDHYTISIEKWGVSDSKTITAKQLSDSRADGQSPVTFGLGGTVTFIKKPVITIDYAQTSATDYPVQTKTEYTYASNGNLERITSYSYSPETSSYTATQYSTFSFVENRVSKLRQYTAADDKLILEDNYKYGVNGDLLQINETNYNSSLIGTMDLTFDVTLAKSKADYSYSNGSGFDYRFSYGLKNIVSDMTINGGQTCNQGTYAYDRNINPFKHLGYVSFVLDNYSINNRLTEDVVFSGCSFPTLVPESYTYKYDDSGYPTEKTTHYKGRNEVTVTKYYYQVFPQ